MCGHITIGAAYIYYRHKSRHFCITPMYSGCHHRSTSIAAKRGASAGGKGKPHAGKHSTGNQPTGDAPHANGETVLEGIDLVAALGVCGSLINDYQRHQRYLWV